MKKINCMDNIIVVLWGKWYYFCLRFSYSFERGTIPAPSVFIFLPVFFVPCKSSPAPAFWSEIHFSPKNSDNMPKNNTVQKIYIVMLLRAYVFVRINRAFVVLHFTRTYNRFPFKTSRHANIAIFHSNPFLLTDMDFSF